MTEKSKRFHFLCQVCHCPVRVELTESNSTKGLFVAAPPFLARIHWVVGKETKKQARHLERKGVEPCKGGGRSTMRVSPSTEEDARYVQEARKRLEREGPSRPLSPGDIARISADSAPADF
jgi:hypothetical protein